MDKAKLNAIFNSLKELVGDQGAFTLFAVGKGGEGAEDLQVRMHGPTSRIMGVLQIGSDVTADFLSGKIQGSLKRIVEPD